MEDAWDWVEEELKKIQSDMPVDSEMMQVVDAISVADFWKRRYDEELMLWERKLETKEDERHELQTQAQTHEMAIKELDIKLRELERRWDHEKHLLEERIKTKEIEATLEKTKNQWDTKIKTLEDQNRLLRMQSGQEAGEAVSALPEDYSPDLAAVRQVTDKQLRDLQLELKKNEDESRKRLEQLEKEKTEVSGMLTEKERLLASERVRWEKLETEVKTMSSQMAQQLNSLKEREQEHFVILEDLARGFAHRVRNYLGIMSGTVQLCVANYQMEGELKEQLEIVDQNAQDMLKSIEEFLSLARIPEMSLKPIDLGQMIDAVLAPLENKIRTQNVTVVKNFSADVPAVNGDQKLIQDAFGHLMINCIEALPQGGQVAFATSFDQQRGMVTIRISDTGVGIPESQLKKIFQPYFSSKKGHKGLGITIAKRVIDLHRGTLTVESVKGKGTTVVINLLLEPTIKTA